MKQLYHGLLGILFGLLLADGALTLYTQWHPQWLLNDLASIQLKKNQSTPIAPIHTTKTTNQVLRQTNLGELSQASFSKTPVKIGRFTSPQPKLQLAIYPNANRTALNLGLGILNNQIPGTNYTVLAGHSYGQTSNLLLTPLQKVSPTTFTTSDTDFIYHWQTINVQTIDKKAVAILDQNFPTGHRSIKYTTSTGQLQTLHQLNLQQKRTLLVASKPKVIAGQNLILTIPRDHYATPTKHDFSSPNNTIISIKQTKNTTKVRLKIGHDQTHLRLYAHQRQAYLGILTCAEDKTTPVTAKRKFILASLMNVTEQATVKTVKAKESSFKNTIKPNFHDYFDYVIAAQITWLQQLSNML